MKIAFFSTQSYDKLFFNRYKQQHEIVFHDGQLNEQTVELARGCDAICVFVNDQVNKQIIFAITAANFLYGNAGVIYSRSRFPYSVTIDEQLKIFVPHAYPPVERFYMVDLSRHVED